LSLQRGGDTSFDRSRLCLPQGQGQGSSLMAQEETSTVAAKEMNPETRAVYSKL